MSDTLNAARRNALGKGEVRKLRNEGMVPGVIYGKGRDALPVQFPTDVLHSHLSEGGRVVDIAVEGKPLKALIKEVQHDVFTDEILHIDFQIVSMTEKIKLPVAVVLTGELPFPPDQGTLEQLLTEIEVECLPKDAPEQIQLSISELEPGGSIHVSDVEVPAGVKMVTPAEDVIASVVKPTVEEEAPIAEGEEITEPEVIGEEKKEEQEEGKSE